VILQKVREAERDRQFEEFKDRKGTIINGVVKREEYGNVIVDIGRGEGILRRNEKIGREAYRIGDRIRCYIKDVRREARGPQVFLSRTDPQFMAELFKMEVPEIYDGIIEIKAVARDPGSRAKIAVISYDNSIDPVGACVGMRGSRVQAVVNELQGEKIDIIPWNQDQATFLVNALQPAQVSKVVVDEDAGKIEVVVPDEQLSLAIGRRGQNVRLASQLTGLDIDILTEAEESTRRQAEFAERTKLFMDTLDVDEMMAQLLVAEGFTNLEEVAYVDQDELLSIDGFDEGTAEELQARARDFWKNRPSQGAGSRPRDGCRGQPDRIRRPDAADAGGAGQGRHQDAGRLRHLRRLGTGGRLDHRKRPAQEGRRHPREVRHEPGRGADPDHDRPRHAGLGRPDRNGCRPKKTRPKTRRPRPDLRPRGHAP
jgi:N utilization substance protein A